MDDILVKNSGKSEKNQRNLLLTLFSQKFKPR